MKKICLLLLSILFVNLLFSQKVNSREEAISLVENDCNSFKSLDEKYRADKEIVLLALINCDGGGNFEYADKSLQKDKDFILELIDNNALSLKDLDYSLRKDKEIIFKEFNLENPSISGIPLPNENGDFSKEVDNILASLSSKPSKPSRAPAVDSSEALKNAVKELLGAGN